jgi:hypothetical protein
MPDARRKSGRPIAFVASFNDTGGSKYKRYSALAVQAIVAIARFGKRVGPKRCAHPRLDEFIDHVGGIACVIEVVNDLRTFVTEESVVLESGWSCGHEPMLGRSEAALLTNAGKHPYDFDFRVVAAPRLFAFCTLICAAPTSLQRPLTNMVNIVSSCTSSGGHGISG